MGRKQSRELSPKMQTSKEKGVGFKHRQQGLRAKVHTFKNSLVARAEKTLATAIQTWGCVEQTVDMKTDLCSWPPLGRRKDQRDGS